MRWIQESLNRKFIVGTVSGVVISFLVFLILFISMYRSELEQERMQTVSHVNQLLRTSLENAMLKRDLEGLRYIVSHLGLQAGIASVKIINPKGEIRFSSNPDQLGSYIKDDLELKAAITRFKKDKDGKEVLRSIHPVQNSEACTQCHHSVSENPINGLLVIDFDADPIRRQAMNTTLMLMGSGAIIVLLNIIGGWWFIRRYVLRPVGKLSAASEALSAGQLDTRVNMPGRDEFAQLGSTFNQMANNLQEQFTELEEKETFLQGLVDAIPDGVRVIGSDCKLRLINQTFRKQQGLPATGKLDITCHKSSHQLDTPCPATLLTCPLHEITQNCKPVKVLHEHKKPDGSVLEVEVYAAPMVIEREGKTETFIVESIRDLGSQIKFSQEQKLSELGKLAAGVAHEIHNPLASVRLAQHSINQALEKETRDYKSIKNYMDIVDKEIDKCIDVTERLLKLSSTPEPTPELVSVNDTVFETLSLLSWEAEQLNVKLITRQSDERYRVLATESELRMLTLNLAQNAFHAMRDGGELRIQLGRKEGWVEISFEDTGVGINNEDIKKIFDPFFSRRADGSHGTGLGLSICKTIVEKYNGKLSVKSTLGLGSRFTVLIPDADKIHGEKDETTNTSH